MKVRIADVFPDHIPDPPPPPPPPPPLRTIKGAVINRFHKKAMIKWLVKHKLICSKAEARKGCLMCQEFYSKWG